jgi:hypothetical protein
MKEINPRLKDLSLRLGSERIAEKDRKIAEELEKQKQEIEKREREEILRIREKLVRKLEYDTKKQESMRKYIAELNEFKGGDLEISVYAFVNHPDFPVIYNQVNNIESQYDKWGHLVRRAYEIGNEVNVHIGHTAQNNEVGFKRALEEYGLFLLCPYFEQDLGRKKGSLCGELCLIDGEEISSSCSGRHDLCVVFEDRAKKSAEGSVQLPKIERTPIKKQIPEMDVGPVDLEDLEDWWKFEGKYE